MAYRGPWNASSYRQRNPRRASTAKLSTRVVGDPANNLRYYEPGEGWVPAGNNDDESDEAPPTPLSSEEDSVCSRCGVMECACRPFCEKHWPGQYLLPPREQGMEQCKLCVLESDVGKLAGEVAELKEAAPQISAPAPSFSAADFVKRSDAIARNLTDYEIKTRVVAFARQLDITLEHLPEPEKEALRLSSVHAGTEYASVCTMRRLREYGEAALAAWFDEVARVVIRERARAQQAARDEAAKRAYEAREAAALKGCLRTDVKLERVEHGGYYTTRFKP